MKIVEYLVDYKECCKKGAVRHVRDEFAHTLAESGIVRILGDYEKPKPQIAPGREQRIPGRLYKAPDNPAYVRWGQGMRGEPIVHADGKTRGLIPHKLNLSHIFGDEEI